MNPLAMIDMKSKLKNNCSSKDANKNNTISEFTKGNLTQIEDKLIRELIHGEVLAENDVKANPTISLEEAVKRVKSGR
ncbi:hypothetical protein E9840_02325 [Tissierella creatinini]|nr:hypothetical protein E9840_02325 [Tissierella creatinini]TJX63918.1 hypothetical protein E8P77_13735 [Soehngenia saccharolytica]